MMKELDKVIEKCTVTIDENGIIKELNIDTNKFPAQIINIGKKVGDYFSKMNGNRCKIIKIEGEEIIIVVPTPGPDGQPDPIDPPKPEKRMIYWVFQGKTFDEEYKGGYIWAPKFNKRYKNIGAPHHWSRLTEVKRGDIIIHGCKGQIMAISVAKDECFDCKQPKELEREGLWDADGRMVKCEYNFIRNPINVYDYKDEIIKRCNHEYGPFNKNGEGNMGYLFEIDRDLAKLFIKETVESNKDLRLLDFIKELLAES